MNRCHAHCGRQKTVFSQSEAFRWKGRERERESANREGGQYSDRERERRKQ